MSCHQGAYQCGRLADQIILFVTDIITCALDKESTVCVAFLDLRKPFDFLDHSILLNHLHKLGVYCTSGIQSCYGFITILLIGSKG